MSKTHADPKRQAVGLQPNYKPAFTQGLALGWYEAGPWPEGSGRHEIPFISTAELVGNDKRFNVGWSVKSSLSPEKTGEGEAGFSPPFGTIPPEPSIPTLKRWAIVAGPSPGQIGAQELRAQILPVCVTWLPSRNLC